MVKRLDALRAFQATSGERETRVELDPEIKAVMLQHTFRTELVLADQKQWPDRIF